MNDRMKLHYTVEDESGTVSVVFWDKHATQLVDYTASQLQFILKEVDDASCDYLLAN